MHCIRDYRGFKGTKVGNIFEMYFYLFSFITKFIAVFNVLNSVTSVWRFVPLYDDVCSVIFSIGVGTDNVMNFFCYNSYVKILKCSSKNELIVICLY